MLFPLLFTVVLGTIQGHIEPPPGVTITKPVQVAVFSGEYVNLYLAEVQKRLDSYWEDYKLAFIQDKEAFALFRDRAQHQAMDVTLNRMRRDDPLKFATFVKTTSNNNFEFRGVPQGPEGECKVVALVTIGNQEFIWSESVILNGETPASVTLKPTTP